MAEDEIILLDVGGMKFKTRKGTLNKSGYFKALLGGSFGDKPKDGSYFIDRNGEYFKYLLDYMRYGYVSIQPQDALMIHTEAQFYQIALDLTEAIQRQAQSQSLVVKGWKTLVYYKEVNGVRTSEEYDYPTWYDIQVNGKPLRTQWSKYKLNKSQWIKSTGKSYDTFVDHLVQNCGYELISNSKSGREWTVSLRQPTAKAILIKQDSVKFTT